MNGQKEKMGIEWWLSIIGVLLMILGVVILFVIAGEMPWFPLVASFAAAEFFGIVLLWMAKITTLLGEISNKLDK